MTAAAKEKSDVTLPEGVSLRRMAQVLVDAWEADPRRWMNQPAQLREDAPASSTMPVPEDALDLFRLLEPHLLKSDMDELKKLSPQNNCASRTRNAKSKN